MAKQRSGCTSESLGHRNTSIHTWKRFGMCHQRTLRYGDVLFCSVQECGHKEGEAEKLLTTHNDYVSNLLKRETLVTEGIFGANGRILMFKENLKDEILEADDAIKNGAVTAEFKVLWIAKGSFCEK